MDQLERTGSLHAAVKAAFSGYFSTMQTAMPGIVEDVDFTKCTCSVRPAIKAQVQQQDGTKLWVALPLLVDVPIVFPCAGGFAITFPLAKGDEVLVIFGSRCIDAWWQNGFGTDGQIQTELRNFDLSDGFAIPGPRSVPNALVGISPDSMQLRSKDGTSFVELAAGGVVNIVAPGGLNINGTTIDSGDGTFDGVDVKTHIHSGVQTGGGNTGPPV